MITAQFLVPTLRVGTYAATLCVEEWDGDAECRDLCSHAERGNEG
jgi:hypothetical protein